MNIRSVNDDRDVAVIQGLYEGLYPAPFPSVKQLLTTHNIRVAEADDGSVVGFRAISPRYFVWVVVVAEHRRRGIGRLLMNEVLEYAAAAGATKLIVRVDDTHAAALAFCERFDFKPYLHMVNLELDLNNWDDSAFESTSDSVTAAGIRFKTYADYENNASNQERLYTLNKALSATVPREEPQTFVDFETYVEYQLSSKNCPHNGIYLAVDGDQWIGMSQISLHESFAFVEMTGVLPAYRGCGVAQALKHLTLQFAQHNHRQIVKTFNDVSNAPMIAVNEKIGFRRGQSFYQMRRMMG